MWLRLTGTQCEQTEHGGDFGGDFLSEYPCICPFPLPFRCCGTETSKMQKAPHYRGFFWSEREDLNLRPLVSQTSALTGLRHAPNAVR